MKQKFSILSVLVLFLFATSLKAEVKLPAIFGDNMVLQQQTDAAIWGNASANKTVKITTSWNKKSYSTKADSEGKWKIKVQTPSAGGPFSITVSDGKILTLNNVLIGEVWVCSGQSNMQMTMRGYRNQPVLGANEAIASSENANIRLITIDRVKNLKPQEDFPGKWVGCQ